MADETPTLDLRILSPSTEVEGGVSFPNLPASTTIKELRSRIQDAVPSKPAPERMRLIYRGRVVANDADTLGNVFGADNMRESKHQSLHLVLRELPSSATPSASPAPRSSTAPPNPFRPAQAPMPASPPLQTNPFRTIPQPRANSQPHTLQPHHHHHHHHHIQAPPNTFPMPALEQHLRQTMAAQNAHATHTQASTAQGQQSSQGAPATDNGAQWPQPGAGQAPLLGFGQPNMPPTAGRIVRQEGIGPNGERWSVTINETNVMIPNVPTRPQQPVFPQPTAPPIAPPTAFSLPPRPATSPTPSDVMDRLLPRIRTILQSTWQDMLNVQAMFQRQPRLASTSPPNWHDERPRAYLRTLSGNLDLVERGLAVIFADSTLAQNPDLIALRQSATEAREYVENMVRELPREQGETAAGQTPSATGDSSSPVPGASTPTPSIPIPSRPQTQSTAQSVPADTPAELFILSSPQGPVGILFDQRGMYTTAPMVPTLPFQTFTNQFAQNRQLIAGIGQQIAYGSSQLHNQLANIQPTPTQQPATGGQAANQTQDQAQNQIQNQNQNPVPDANPPPEQDRMLNIAGHLWLILKLACFVYFFAGGGGFYRPIVLGIIAGIVYLAQIGMFEEQVRVVRRYFEVGALAERAAQRVDGRVNNDQGQQRNASMGNLTPEQAAQRLLQQRRDERFGWVRERMRTVERSVTIFVASLWPGIGEQMVEVIQAEEMGRAEAARQAAEQVEAERRRQEEDKSKQETEAQVQVEQDTNTPKTEETANRPSEGSSLKGKEKAVSAEADADATGSGSAF